MPNDAAESHRAAGRILECLNISPVLVDLGASGATPEIWNCIAGRCVYLGFDPDSREIDPQKFTRFFDSHILPCAVTAGDSAQVAFYFTRSPFCSSTLKPDFASLEDYLFADLFQVENVAEVGAKTLNDILAELGYTRVHWLKVDTQGTDLRIFRSLSASIREGVLALDMEPGLIDAYVDEDLFVDVHRELLSAGYWLSRLNV